MAMRGAGQRGPKAAGVVSGDPVVALGLLANL